MYDISELEEDSALGQWQFECRQEYEAYKKEACTCEFNEDCMCMTFKQFENFKLKNLQDYWDWREEDYNEGELYVSDCS